jgi:hypothetical protein
MFELTEQDLSGEEDADVVRVSGEEEDWADPDGREAKKGVRI